MTNKAKPGELNQRTDFDGRTTIQMEKERLRQMVLTTIASRCETDRLNADVRNKPPITWKKPSDGGYTGGHNFITLPRGLNGRAAPHWLVLVDSLGVHAPIGIEIVSDVTLGLSRPGHSAPDFDFSPYNGADHGVSRRHAMIRPSINHLYLIDLASTNGTRLNGLLLEPNRPVPVANGDLVSLGALTFCVKVVATPADYNSAQHR